MNWTKEIPTIDGWYWIRHEDDGGHSIDWVETESLRAWTQDRDFEDTTSGYEFYGPLEEPK